jgi:hypothetical protein
MKYVLKYVLIPLVVIAGLIFLIFHKPIVRYFTFDKTFHKLIENRGRNVAVDYVNELLALGPKAEEPLINKYQSSYSVVEKYYALYLLGRLHSEKAAPLLLGALQSKESGVRAGAVRGLKHMMKPEYVQPVAGLLTDHVRDIRFDAVATLGAVNCPESIQVLRQFVLRERDQNIWARAWLSLRYLLPADGVVVEKFRINKHLQIMPADEMQAEVGYTYFFLRLKEPAGEKIMYVTRPLWQEAKVGDRLEKKAETEEMRLIPAPEKSK